MSQPTVVRHFYYHHYKKYLILLATSANDKYDWLGAEEAEIVFLNDFRCLQEIIAWKELPILLEGQAVRLRSPKNHYSNNICIDKDTPIVSTSKGEITYVGNLTPLIQLKMK